MGAVIDAAVLAQRREEDERSRLCGEEGSYGDDFRGMGCDGCPLPAGFSSPVTRELLMWKMKLFSP